MERSLSVGILPRPIRTLAGSKQPRAIKLGVIPEDDRFLRNEETTSPSNLYPKDSYKGRLRRRNKLDRNPHRDDRMPAELISSPRMPDGLTQHTNGNFLGSSRGCVRRYATSDATTVTFRENGVALRWKAASERYTGYSAEPRR